MSRLPPLNGLRAFEAAARHLSFRLAADELGVTPTAISHQIKGLEQHCGQKLFRRRPQPTVLTEAGQQLYPLVHEGFDVLAKGLAAVRGGLVVGKLRVTATNAFSARWLLPRLPHWRRTHPELTLEIIGTDDVLDLSDRTADVAVRYARKAPSGLESEELVRDSFHVVGAPGLIGDAKLPLSPKALSQFPLIETGWPVADKHAPTWRKWRRVAKRRYRSVPDYESIVALSFREELHAIEAAISGQGLAICSDVLVASELSDGRLVSVAAITLSGYGFYLSYRAASPRREAIRAFALWIRDSTPAI